MSILKAVCVLARNLFGNRSILIAEKHSSADISLAKSSVLLFERSEILRDVNLLYLFHCREVRLFPWSSGVESPASNCQFILAFYANIKCIREKTTLIR